ncbi:kelch-like protein 17 [Glossina fuscipes]|uniref:Kelch-like protein diablo n=1 Tax=Glossina fuscipes TaxID=7396 RepID=A0A9C5ZBV7_9MUSC|nr:kelch-like protein 17 [Glossina fuscipes]
MAAKFVNEVERISPKKCENLDYGKTYLERLTKMRINQKLFDFSLDVDGELIYVHKLALAIASDYFAAMFEADMKVRKEGTVKLQDVDVVAVKVLVDYIYSGVITLTEGNVEAVLSASDLFQIVWVKEQCALLLKNNVNRENCCRVRKLADMHSCKDLQGVCHQYILDNFDDLVAEEHLQFLSFDEIKELIKDVQNIVQFEDIAYKAAINWVKHDLERRRVHLAELMSQIRLPLVSSKFLRDHIVGEPLLTEDEKCNKFLIEVLAYQLTKVTQLHEKSQTETMHSNENLHVLLGGGTMDLVTGIKECKMYDISKKCLVSIISMNEDRFCNSLVPAHNRIYTLGGYNGGALNTAEYYDPVSKRWIYVAPMNNSRYGFGSCTYNDLVYVVGGYCTCTVESYHSATNTWYLCKNIPVTVGLFNRATVEENSIYSLTRETNGKNALFRFDPREDKWCVLNVMPARSAQYELISYERTLFAMGKNDCKRLDIRRNKWEPMPKMLSNRIGFSIVAAAKNIYAFGGEEGNFRFVKTVERFNINNNEWTIIDPNGMQQCRGGAAVLPRDLDFN